MFSLVTSKSRNHYLSTCSLSLDIFVCICQEGDCLRHSFNSFWPIIPQFWKHFIHGQKKNARAFDSIQYFPHFNCSCCLLVVNVFPFWLYSTCRIGAMCSFLSIICIECVSCSQLHLLYSANRYEHLQAVSRWSENMHVVWMFFAFFHFVHVENLVIFWLDVGWESLVPTPPTVLKFSDFFIMVCRYACCLDNMQKMWVQISSNM